MNEVKDTNAFAKYMDSKEDLQKLPLFYRYFELYEDEIALDVEDCNMVYSKFHQSKLHVIGFFFKGAAVIQLDSSQLMYKLQ